MLFLLADLLEHSQTHMSALTSHLKEVEMELLLGNHFCGFEVLLGVAGMEYAKSRETTKIQKERRE